MMKDTDEKIVSKASAATNALSKSTIASTSTIKPTVIIDHTNATRDITHYIAVTIWVGWFFFYLVFTLSLPMLYYKFPSLLTVIVGLLIVSFFSSADIRKQPKVCHTFYIVLLTLNMN